MSEIVPYSDPSLVGSQYTGMSQQQFDDYINRARAYYDKKSTKAIEPGQTSPFGTVSNSPQLPSLRREPWMTKAGFSDAQVLEWQAYEQRNADFKMPKSLF